MEYLLSALQCKSHPTSLPRQSPFKRPLSPSLLDLTSDPLNAIAFWLPPRDRLNFALTCRAICSHVWGPTALIDLVERFPLERHVNFDLCVSFPPSTQGHKLRIVPRRASQQHVHVAVTSDGGLVAVLPYDNILRLINMAHRHIDAVVPIFPFVCYDLWDLTTGRGEINATPAHSAYADEAGLDVEVAFEFSADNRILLISSARCVRLYRVTMHNGCASLAQEREIDLDDALIKILGRVDYCRAVGGSAALSPDGKSLTWIVFCGTPASVFVTIWDVNDGHCRAVREAAKVHPRRRSSLGWARVTYAPNGLYLLVVVNTAKMMVRLERVEGEFRRLTLCQFVTIVFEAKGGAALPASSSTGTAGVRHLVAVRERCQWLELGPDAFGQKLASAVMATMEGLVLSDNSPEGFCKGRSSLSQRRQLIERGLALNGMHSCPGEATYKTLTFGNDAKHAWLITKQPMFSLHFGLSGERVHVTSSPHANVIQTLVWSERTDQAVCTRNASRELEMAIAATGAEKSESESHELRRRRRAGPQKRGEVFRGMAWRTGFATVTAFSASGKWIAGAALLENDECSVYLRNMTLAEYFD